MMFGFVALITWYIFVQFGLSSDDGLAYTFDDHLPVAGRRAVDPVLRAPRGRGPGRQECTLHGALGLIGDLRRLAVPVVQFRPRQRRLPVDRKSTRLNSSH